MKILQYHTNLRLERGGTVRFVLDLALALAQAGHEVTIASADMPDFPPEWEQMGAGVPKKAVLPGPLLPADFLKPAALQRMRSLLESHDVLHVHGAWGTSNVQATRLSRELGKPYVASPHGMLDDWTMRKSHMRKRLFLAMGGRKLFEQASAAICTAQAELDQSSKWFPKGRGIVIPPVVDLAPYRELPGKAPALKAHPLPLQGAPVVLFLSRVHPKKKVEVLIEAVAKLKGEGLGCNLLIAGTGERDYEQEMRRLVADRGVGDRTAFLGMVTGTIKTSLYQVADVFALPTSQENFGLVLAESLLCGTPVITTKGVDIWPELESSGGAVIADDTASAFAAAIGDMLRNPERRMGMGRTGEAWVRNYLEPSRVVERYVEEYARARDRALVTKGANGDRS